MRILTRKGRLRADAAETADAAPENPSAGTRPDTPARSRWSVRRPGVAAAAVCVAVAGAAVAGIAGSAAAAPAPASTQSSSASSPDPANDESTLFVGACTAADVSFYYGGFTQGLSAISFDVTIAAHDGIACSLRDNPDITVTGPASQAPIPLGFGGRGGTLVLRPNSPLHTTLSFSAPDLPTDGLQASVLHLGFADGTSQAAYFEVPGGVEIDSGGIFVSAWSTGLGGGEGD